MKNQTEYDALDKPEVGAAVDRYLTARATAELTREKVDAVYADILREVLIENTEDGKRITSNKMLYRASDEDFALVLDIADKRLREDGIKPDDMSRDYCPALVAEGLQREAERDLIDVAGGPLSVTNDRLHSLPKRKEFIDLVVGFTLARRREQVVAS